MFKGEKGITLIALAITIIVLLILAGISLTALNQSGILGQATNASSLYKQRSMEEAASLSVIEAKLSELASNAGYSSL